MKVLLLGTLRASSPPPKQLVERCAVETIVGLWGCTVQDRVHRLGQAAEHRTFRHKSSRRASKFTASAKVKREMTITPDLWRCVGAPGVLLGTEAGDAMAKAAQAALLDTTLTLAIREGQADWAMRLLQRNWMHRCKIMEEERSPRDATRSTTTAFAWIEDYRSAEEALALDEDARTLYLEERAKLEAAGGLVEVPAESLRHLVRKPC